MSRLIHSCMPTIVQAGCASCRMGVSTLSRLRPQRKAPRRRGGRRRRRTAAPGMEAAPAFGSLLSRDICLRLQGIKGGYCLQALNGANNELLRCRLVLPYFFDMAAELVIFGYGKVPFCTTMNQILAVTDNISSTL
jgi:hypothetical protein